jgi:hypothetical protein
MGALVDDASGMGVASRRSKTRLWLASGAGLGLLILAGTTGCTAGSAPTTAAGSSPSRVPAVSGSAGAVTAVPAATPNPSASADQGGVQNLVASNSVQTQLINVFAAYKQIPMSEMTGIQQGTLYYAYDPSTGTYWAMANFNVSAAAPQSVQVDLQDGGNMGMFKMTGGGGWQMELGAVPPVCAYGPFFPAAVLGAWALPVQVAGIPC